MTRHTAPSTDTVTVWGIKEIGTLTHTCEIGETHTRPIFPTKTLGPVTGYRLYRTGYGPQHDAETALRADAQGRTYHRTIAIDYGSNGAWVRDDGKMFMTRPVAKALTVTEALALARRVGATIDWLPAR